MKVFKGFLMMLKRNLHVVVMYLAIFLTILVMIQTLAGGKELVRFEAERLNIAVIDRDQGVLAKGLAEYLGNYHDLVDVEDDPAVIQEELFYRNLYYVVTIPEGFEEKVLEQGEKLAVTTVPGTMSTYYVDQQINTYLNGARMMTNAGFSTEETVQELLAAAKTEPVVELLDQNGHGGERPAFSYLFQYLPYLMLAAICYSMCFILIEFRQGDIRRRMLCSAVSLRSQNVQILLGFLVAGIGLWAFCMLIPVVMYGKAFWGDANAGYYLVNSFVLMLVSLSIAFTLGCLIPQGDSADTMVNGAVNVISLGMCFSCGVFVPMEILSSGVRRVAQFLPVYWYETVNEMLAEHAAFSGEQLAEIYKGYGIQVLFAAAIVLVGMAFSKTREREIG
ncbi:MAG: ABC transporter permease [Eubacteriales bacterium]|nr:ABC transporter permease [Eubacteriales bacterium]